MTNINTPPPYTGPTPTQQDVPELSMPPIQEAPSRAEQAIEQMKRIAHHAGNLYLRGRIQVSEIGEGIAKIRSRRSAKVMEKMDHKQQLYKHLGIQADSIGEAVPEDTGVVHRDPTSQPPRIRSRAERRMDERITKKQDEAEKSANARRADITDYRGKNYGHVTKRTRNKINRRIEKSGKRRGLTTSEIRLEQIKSRTNFVTPEEYDALSPEDQKNVSTFDTETGKMGKVKADLDSSRPETKQQKRNRLKAEKDYKSLKTSYNPANSKPMACWVSKTT
jgi:hypothetical protein